MWVIYRRSDRKIIGVTALGSNDPHKAAALKEVVEGSVKPGALSDYDAIQVSDPLRAKRYMDAFPDRLVVAGSESAPKLAVRDREVFSLYVESDAEDKHPVDGIPEIPADGTSSTVITITKVDERFKPQKGEGDNDEIFLRTDYGALRAEKGENDIRSVRLEKGQARIRLVSEAMKRVATVQVLSAGNQLEDTFIRIEFI